MKEDDDDIQEYVSSRQRAMEREYNYEKNIRNQTIEEVARTIEKLPFGDTAASFAIFVRDMKK